MRILYKLLLIIILALTQFAYSQTAKHTLSGYVVDSVSGEKVIGATIVATELKLGTYTNSYGFYSLTLPEGNVKVNCIFPGYKPKSSVFILEKDTTLDFQLDAFSVEMKTVEITDKLNVVNDPQMSTINVPVEQIKQMPALFGEVDVIKSIQMLPGVQKGSEGSTGLYVRGGGPDQNLILLDGVPVYNVSHLFGFFSLFNADAISNVQLIKGGFPARYGGRLSSVLDISMKEGNSNKVHGDASIGIVASKLTIEGPIRGGKTTFLVSGRRTYLDLLAQPLIVAATKGNSTGGYFFYDFNAKINHTFSKKDRLYLSTYYGRDKFYFRDHSEEDFQDVHYEYTVKGKMGWGNAIAALRWNHLFSEKLFGNVTLTYSKYGFFVGEEDEDKETSPTATRYNRFALQYDSGIEDLGTRFDFDWYASPNHLVRFGGYATYHTFTPGVTSFKSEDQNSTQDTSFGSILTRGLESAVYIEDDIKIGDKIRINPGLHVSSFYVNEKFYHSFQPRFSGRYMLNENWSLKASWANMQQYLHLLTNSNVGLPTDLWVPATDSIPPQRSWQVAAGLARVIPSLNLEITVEGYYKFMHNLIDYKEGASFFELDNDWQKKVTVGNGWSYGGEVLIHRKRGKFNGWIGYTLSWTMRKFPEINFGNVYPAKYDRRHDLSVVTNYKIKENIDFGMTWVYGTGNAITLPVAVYNNAQFDIPFQTSWISQVQYYEEKNSYRMRAFHRLDLGINLHKKKKWYTRTWSFSVYNAYNRHNPFFLFFEQDFRNQLKAREVSLFPVIPSVAWRITF